MLRYRDHLISKNERTEHIFNQVERITPLIISDIKKSELYNNAYEELILIAAMYGKVESFKTLINSTIPFSTNTYNLICDYAIRFPEKDEKTKELLEEALGFKSLEETFKRNTSKEDLTVNELANHIFMYYTTRRIVSPIQDIYTILPNIALENIISYFDNAQDIITELNKLEEKYGCRRTFPIIDRNIKRKKLSSLNQTREVYEYSMYRCFNPDTEENIKKQETAKKIAQHLLNNFELAKEEKNTSKPKIKQKKIPYKLKEILINYK